jgi:GGDEF domain-containing protein
MNRRIPIKDAKEELVRINSILTKPHILIGGLAVNQYIVSRNSNDIDLVVEFETANKIISELYPSLLWNKIDKNDDEIRPSYEIINRQNSELIIRFGPKILQRQPYPFLDWDILFNGAKKFSYQKSELSNILVPSPLNLSFTKLISYTSRRDSHIEKALADLDDFSNLTNDASWNTIDFYTIMAKTNAFSYLKDNLKFSKTEKDILDKSSFYQLVNLFRDPTSEISKIPNPTELQKQRVEKAISNGEKFASLQNEKSIAAIGIDLIGFTAINMKYGPDIGDKIILTIEGLIEKADLQQHKTEIVGDTFIVYLIVEKENDLENYASKLHTIINSHNWREIQHNLFVNAYTTFGFLREGEAIHEFSKRIFDSILSQKEQGYIFKGAKEQISRRDWGIEQMVSHRDI